MTRVYTAGQVLDALTAEGHHPVDVRAVFDSLTRAGLELAQPDDGTVITGGELQVLREQLEAR